MCVRVLLACLLATSLGCGGTADEEADVTGPRNEADSFGEFRGEVVGVWDPNGRDMTLREDFIYIDPRKKEWKAPSESVVNGASIPRVFWSVIGGPFEGRYRSASVIHDVACVEMAEPWEDVYKMFYEACRCGGVGEKKAKLIYWAVQNFGPRWRIVGRKAAEDGAVLRVSQPISSPAPPANIVAIVEDYFEANNPTLTEIESLTVAEIQETVEEAEPLKEGDSGEFESEPRDEAGPMDVHNGQPEEVTAEVQPHEQSEPVEPAAEGSIEPANMQSVDSGKQGEAN